MPESPSGVKEQSTQRDRLRRPTRTQARAKPAPAQPSPTRSIEPGHVHYRIAGGILKGVQAKAADAGINLDIGEIPPANGEAVAEGDDPERLTRIVAHAVARIADRFTVTRKLTRHLEGKDKRSGLLADISAATIELYHRNPEAIETLGKQAATDFKARREARAAEKATNNGGIANASR